MAKFARHLNSFVAGELSPRFYGRTDAEQYSQGAQEITNKIVRAQGGVSRRPGSVLTAQGIEVTSDDPYTLTAFDSEIREIDFRFSRKEAAVVVLSTGSNGLNSYGIAIWEPTASGGVWVNPTVSLTSGYKAFAGWASQTELDEIQYSQSGDVLVLVSKNNPPIYISRTAAQTYTLRDIYSLRTTFPASNGRTTYTGGSTTVQEKVTGSAPPTSAQAYYNFPYRTFRSFTFTPSATTGSIVLTNNNSSDKCESKYVGTILRMTKTGVTGFVRVDSIQGAPNEHKFNATVLKTLGGTGAQDSIEEQDFGVDTEGWPRAVCFHDQRIYYANITDKPNSLWASQVGDYTELMIVRPADDSNFSALSNDRPFSFTLSSTQVDDICWMLSSKSSLFIGTVGGEYLGLASQDNILGPLNPNFQPQTQYGSKAMQAINVNGSIIFVDRTGQHLREFTYNRDVDNYRAIDLLYFADHMIRKALDIYPTYEYPEIVSLSVQEGQNSVIYVRDSNGMLHCLCREKDYGTLAWSTIEFGGAWDADGRPPKIKAVCTIPNLTANDDDVYVIVERYINSQTVRLLERIGMEFIGPSLGETSTDIRKQPVFMDSCQFLFPMANPRFLSKYGSSLNADYFTTTTTGTGTGSPVGSNGLALTAGTLKYVSYDGGNAILSSAGTAIVEYIPNYSGSPGTDMHLFAIAKTNADNANLFSFFHRASDGKLVIVLNDSAGVAITTTVSSDNWDPVSGQKYVLMATYQVGTGIKIFVNGIQLSTLNTPGAGTTRSTDIGRFVVGTSYNAGHNSNFTIRKIGLAATYVSSIIFNSGYAFGTHPIGVTHLFGDSEVLLDGQYLGQVDLQTGELPDAPETLALVGMPYTSRITLMDLEAGSILGSAQGSVKRSHEITARFERTVGARYGIGESMYDLEFTPVNHVNNTPIPLYTGDKTLKFPLGYNRNYAITIEQTLPFPCTLTSVVIRGLTADA